MGRATASWKRWPAAAWRRQLEMSTTPVERLPAVQPAVPVKMPGLLDHVRTALGSVPGESDSAGFRSFELEAGDVMSRARTQRAQKIVRAALVVVVLLIVWACLAHVDEITK